MEELINIFEIEKLLDKLEEKINFLRKLRDSNKISNPQELDILEYKTNQIVEELKSKIHPFNRVQIARHPKRPTLQDIIENVFSEFTELKGDRYVGDDSSLLTGLAKIENYPVFLIGNNKGKTINEKIKRNYGMSNPEGFYKAIRIMEVANSFRTPIITIVDTPGAYPGDTAEQNGQYIAISRSISKMFEVEVPIVCLILSEGGSGGALAIAVANYVLMMENAYYSVISPEGAASILYRDSSKAPIAAKNLKFTSYDLFNLGIIDEIIFEPFMGIHRDLVKSFQNIKNKLIEYIQKASKINNPKEHRFQRYRKIGFFETVNV